MKIPVRNFYSDIIENVTNKFTIVRNPSNLLKATFQTHHQVKKNINDKYSVDDHINNI